MSDEWNPNLETEQEYSERMHRENHFDEDHWDDDERSEPIGSCDWCGTNIYEDDFDCLCNQCAWHAAQGEGCDDAGSSGMM